MDEYKITLAHSAYKELEDLDSINLNRIFPKIESLKNNPRPRGFLKIKGKENLYRIRLGEYRIIYSIYDKDRLIDIIAVCFESLAIHLIEIYKIHIILKKLDR